MEMNIKKNAKKSFSNKDYKVAVQTLLELGVEGFITYSIKNKWFQEVDFLKEITFMNKEFYDIFKSEKADEFLYAYFSNDLFVDVFEQSLAERCPGLLINAYRVSQVFLKEERYDFIMSLPFDDEFNIHKKTWKFLYQRDLELWKEISKELNLLKKRTCQDILTDLVNWLENKRFGMPNNFYLHHLSDVYSFFIELYSKEVNLDEVDIDLLDFAELFLNKIFVKGKSNPKFKLLDLIDEWLMFKTSLLSVYCFDLTTAPINNEGIIYFNESPLSFYNRQLDGIRYTVNNFAYAGDASQYVDAFIDKKAICIPKGKSKLDEEKNYSLTVKDFQLNLFLEDLCIEHLSFKNSKVKAFNLFKPLLAYSTNRLDRYEAVLSAHRDVSKNWKENYQYLFESSFKKKLQNDPFFLMSEQEYSELNASPLNNFTEDVTDDIINLFSYQANKNRGFDRLNLTYSVWYNPFVRIGKKMFCPMMFIANNDWFYAFSQAGLRNLDRKSNNAERKRTSDIMENRLADSLEKKNWEVQVIDSNKANEINGDVDIIVKDDNTTLFMQLKRTYFRMCPKDIYFEQINSERKAAKQLTKAEVFFRKDNSIFNLKGDVTKWIVSTSFEGIKTVTDSCTKYNYFDILRSLRDPKIKKVSDLIEFLEKDQIIRQLIEIGETCPNEISLSAFNLPIPMVKSNEYCNAVFIEKQRSKKYDKMFNQALDYDEKGLKKEAIDLLLKCIELNANDLDVYSALGNIYADVKDFVNSYSTFEKALSIEPNDPFILRNYALAFGEEGKCYKCLSVFLDLYERFPFVGDTKELFEKNFGIMLLNKLITPEQSRRLALRFKSLN